MSSTTTPEECVDSEKHNHFFLHIIFVSERVFYRIVFSLLNYEFEDNFCIMNMELEIVDEYQSTSLKDGEIQKNNARYSLI